MATPIRCVILRGGTSKGVYLRESDLPADPAARDRAILGVFGSPDRRQIDGLGGADPLTSKVCIIGPPPRDLRQAAGAELSYTFGQVGIAEPHVDYHSLCGNLTAGVGAFAIWENMVRPVEPVTRIAIYNTNLDRVIACEVPVRDGRPLEAGDYAIPGVPGTGARIQVDLAATAGAATGALLPTGNPVDRMAVPGLGEIEVSYVDIGNAHVFVRARDLGLTGTETAAEIDANTALCATLETIRARAGVVMGMYPDAARATADSPATPFVAMVAPPQDYLSVIEDRMVRAGESDFLSRLMFMQQMHKTYAATSTVCTGIAAKIPGTLVHQAARPETRAAVEVRIGHPAGAIVTESVVELSGNDYVVRRATVGRTARRILEGSVYVP